MAKWLVLLNEKAGTLARASHEIDHAARVSELLREAGIEADVRVVPPQQIEPIVRESLAQPFDAIIAGGGDGTLNSVATMLLDQPMAFGVLPLGTFNHFAKEMGLPVDLDAAVRALATAQPEDLPVGEVNGRIFLNFSAIGLHPNMVSERERGRDPKKSKFLATMKAGWRSVFRLPLMFVRLTLPDREMRRLTPSVIMCNNVHQMRAFGVEAASESDRGVLNFYLARSTKPLGVIWLFILAMLRLLKPSRTFEVVTGSDVTIHMHRRRLTVSIDGELVRMSAPLRYRVRQGALKVLRPRSEIAEGAGAGSALQESEPNGR